MYRLADEAVAAIRRPGREATHMRSRSAFAVIEVRKTELLLNGKPVRMGGVNRYSDHPEFGMIEPKQVIDQDMSLMKSANMELAQPPHYPMPPAMFDWADRHGLLMIEEVGNVWLTPEQMDSPKMRRLFQSQTEEMIRRDWNHPSVIGYSIGNEYDSTSPAGLRWTEDMARSFVAWTRAGLITFGCDRFHGRDTPERGFKKPEDDGSNYRGPGQSEYLRPSRQMWRKAWISSIVFGRTKRCLHQPMGKPWAKSWGKAGQTCPSSIAIHPRRSRTISAGSPQVLRERPWVVGASYWAFADYRSLWPGGTFPDGYRHLGASHASASPGRSTRCCARNSLRSSSATLPSREANRRRSDESARPRPGPRRFSLL